LAPDSDQPQTITDRRSLRRYAWLSVAAAIATIALKSSAYYLTGSIGLLSDAVESLVNLAGAVMALAMLTVAARPPDEDHAWGHSKAEYFSSGVEGTLILIAAISIAIGAVRRLLAPQPLEQIGLGLAVSVVASLINFAVSLTLNRAGKRYHSITLVAGAKHLMTDVLTSAGVVIAVALVGITGWKPLDPLVALLVAANIVWAGIQIVRESIAGLMDVAIPEVEIQAARRAIEAHMNDGVEYHALRTRQAGARRFMSVHILVPGHWTVHEGHQLLERIERDVRAAVPNSAILSHLESLDDPASWEDIDIDRMNQ
jgi:cation diffusion facilitator family transporter